MDALKASASRLLSTLARRPQPAAQEQQEWEREQEQELEAEIENQRANAANEADLMRKLEEHALAADADDSAGSVQERGAAGAEQGKDTLRAWQHWSNASGDRSVGARWAPDRLNVSACRGEDIDTEWLEAPSKFSDVLRGCDGHLYCIPFGGAKRVVRLSTGGMAGHETEPGCSVEATCTESGRVCNDKQKDNEGGGTEAPVCSVPAVAAMTPFSPISPSASTSSSASSPSFSAMPPSTSPSPSTPSPSALRTPTAGSGRGDRRLKKGVSFSVDMAAGYAVQPIGRSLRGDDESLCLWGGGVRGSDDKLYGIPFDAEQVLCFDPATEHAVLEPLPPMCVAASKCSVAKWSRGALEWRSGLIFAAPFKASHVLAYDPATKVAAMVGPDLSFLVEGSSGKFSDIVAHPNGKFYLIPYCAENVLVLHPDRAVSAPDYFLDTPFGPLNDAAGEGGDLFKWSGGVLASNGCIYCVPCGAEFVLKIDVAKNTACPCGESTIQMGVTLKWRGGTLAHDGKIYCTPSNCHSILVIDTATDTTSYIDLRTAIPLKSSIARQTDGRNIVRNVTDMFKWGGAAVAPNGAIYMAPWNAHGFLCVAPRLLLDMLVSPGKKSRSDAQEDPDSAKRRSSWGAFRKKSDPGCAKTGIMAFAKKS